MSIRNFLLTKPKLTRRILEKIPSSILLKLGKKTAYKTLRKAYTTKAYQDFLKSKGIKSIEGIDFKDIPVSDKKSYIKNYKLKDLLVESIENNYTIEESSGYGGNPFYWPRYSGQDDNFVDYMELGLDKVFKISSKKTLMVNTFALGAWVTGVKFARGACSLANREDIPLTVINVGMEKEAAIRAIKTFAKHYEQTIVVGYPPFVKEIIEQCEAIGSLRKNIIHLIVGAESFPEEWRTYMIELLNDRKEKYNPIIVSAYGAADVGLNLGYEQPITILLRKFLQTNKEARYKVLGSDVETVPHFFQYNPLSIWVETKNGELIFTSDTGIPIVRYNLHDSGGILDYSEMIEVLSEQYNVDDLIEKYKPFRLPVVYLRGRTDDVVPVSGAIVYIDQLRKALELPELQKYITGRFYSYSDYNDAMIPQFNLCLEIDSKNAIKGSKKEIKKKVIQTLCKTNQDYRAFYKDKPEQYAPRIQYLTEKEFKSYRNSSLKIRYVKK